MNPASDDRVVRIQLRRRSHAAGKRTEPALPVKVDLGIVGKPGTEKVSLLPTRDHDDPDRAEEGKPVRKDRLGVTHRLLGTDEDPPDGC